MISEKLKLIVGKMNEHGTTAYLEGASEDQVAQFETDHKITFPVKYREWLLYSDGGDCFLPAGVQFYGVARKPHQ
ncbi:MAG: SMI1/KNR4 family protein [Clostridiales bacterium]|nr:SMI1/KNR4 family protein [Clostridiales bacterium]